MGAELRDGQRHRYEPGLQRGVERNDVVQALRREDGRTVPRRSAGRDLSGQRLHAAVELGPGERLGVAGRVDLVVDVRVGRRIGLLPGPLPQHRGNRGFGYCHRDTTPQNLEPRTTTRRALVMQEINRGLAHLGSKTQECNTRAKQKPRSRLRHCWDHRFAMWITSGGVHSPVATASPYPTVS